MAEDIHWADKAAQELIDKENKKEYTLASGITPSGVVHIGNFREVITTDLVARALQKKGKKVRFIYSWDDYDVFRKVPVGMPQPELLKTYLRKAIVDVPDTFECKHKSYAEHNEKQFEKDLPRVGIKPEFLYQHQKYRSCEYAKDMSYALQHAKVIKKILDQYREEPLEENWLPLSVFCEKCGKDTTEVVGYDGKFSVSYTCECGAKETFDIRRKGIAKLPWRVDWPMRWNYEHVEFEPGGKDHSSAGGSFDTGKDIVKQVWKRDPPQYVCYDFIIIKSVGGKMSSSKGNVVDLGDVLEIYTPEVLRWLFAGSRPNSEFAISFDLDVLNMYEGFSKTERIYFGEEKIENEKELEQERRIYELSMLKLPKKMPTQFTFRHLVNYVQMYNGDIDAVMKELKDKSIKEKAQCAWNWIQRYGPEDMKFTVQDTVAKEILQRITDNEKKALKLLAEKLGKNKYDEQKLFDEFYKICEMSGIDNKTFFKIAYNVLIGKDKGPKLASLILALDKKRVLKILGQV